MRFVHTFWSKPLYENKFGDFNTQLKNVLSNYLFSAICVKSFGHEIVLFTDNKGKELLDFIPYDTVYLFNNDLEESIDFAAMIKFEALRHCNLGDIVIDGDLFLYEKGSYDILEKDTSDVMFSFIEPEEHIFYRGSRTRFLSELFYKIIDVPFAYDCYIPDNFKNFHWYNTSLLKINNQKLKDLYLDQYFYHKDILRNIKFEFSWPDVIIEQYFLRQLCEKNNFKAVPVIEDFPSEKALQKSHEIGFEHLGGEKDKLIDVVENSIKQHSQQLFDIYLEQYNKFKVEDDQVIPDIQES